MHTDWQKHTLSAWQLNTDSMSTGPHLWFQLQCQEVLWFLDLSGWNDFLLFLWKRVKELSRQFNMSGGSGDVCSRRHIFSPPSLLQCFNARNYLCQDLSHEESPTLIWDRSSLRAVRKTVTKWSPRIRVHHFLIFFVNINVKKKRKMKIWKTLASHLLSSETFS